MRFVVEAEQALQGLRGDPAMTGLFRAVVEVLRAIRDDPGAAQVRRERWDTRWGPAWAVPVRGRDEDWLVVWRATDDGVVEVLYLGPDVV